MKLAAVITCGDGKGLCIIVWTTFLKTLQNSFSGRKGFSIKLITLLLLLWINDLLTQEPEDWGRHFPGAMYVSANRVRENSLLAVLSFTFDFSPQI